MGPWRERERLRKARASGRNQLAHGDNHGIRSPRAVFLSPPWRATSQVRFRNSGLIAVKFSCELAAFDQLKDQLSQKFPQNSVETRVRYARYVLRWFFPEGLESLPRRVWMAYREEAARFTENFALRKPTFPWLRWNARMFR
jgi:hypothetical protein